MNADLHMAKDFKNTGNGNLFVIFGEPDIDLITVSSDQVQIQVRGIVYYSDVSYCTVTNQPVTTKPHHAPPYLRPNS